MDFEIVGPITDVEMIALGTSIRELSRLRRVYGTGRWRKLKGTASILLARIIHRAGEERSEAGRKRSTDRLWELTEPTAGRCFDVSVWHGGRVWGRLQVLAR